MDIGLIVNILSLVSQYGGTIENLYMQAKSNTDLVTKVETLLPQVAGFANQIATAFFPGSASTVHNITAATIILNQRLVRYVQQACNLLLTSTSLPKKLVVDGVWGPNTAGAFKALQKQLGVTVDGVIGKVTEAAIKQALPNLAM